MGNNNFFTKLKNKDEFERLSYINTDILYNKLDDLLKNVKTDSLIFSETLTKTIERLWKSRYGFKREFSTIIKYKIKPEWKLERNVVILIRAKELLETMVLHEITYSINILTSATKTQDDLKQLVRYNLYYETVDFFYIKIDDRYFRLRKVIVDNELTLLEPERVKFQL